MPVTDGDLARLLADNRWHGGPDDLVRNAPGVGVTHVATRRCQAEGRGRGPLVPNRCRRRSHCRRDLPVSDDPFRDVADIDSVTAGPDARIVELKE